MANVYYTLYYGNGKEFYIHNGLKSKSDLIKKALSLNINSGYFTEYDKDTIKLKYYSLEILVNNESKKLTRLSIKKLDKSPLAERIRI